MIVMFNEDLPSLEELHFGDGACYGYYGDDDSDGDSDDDSDGDSDGDSDSDENVDTETPNQREQTNQVNENESKVPENDNPLHIETLMFESIFFFCQ